MSTQHQSNENTMMQCTQVKLLFMGGVSYRKLVFLDEVILVVVACGPLCNLLVEKPEYSTEQPLAEHTCTTTPRACKDTLTFAAKALSRAVLLAAMPCCALSFWMNEGAAGTCAWVCRP
jgi:hypothetical protein